MKKKLFIVAISTIFAVALTGGIAIANPSPSPKTKTVTADEVTITWTVSPDIDYNSWDVVSTDKRASNLDNNKHHAGSFDLTTQEDFDTVTLDASCPTARGADFTVFVEHDNGTFEAIQAKADENGCFTVTVNGHSVHSVVYDPDTVSTNTVNTSNVSPTTGYESPMAALPFVVFGMIAVAVCGVVVYRKKHQ